MDINIDSTERPWADSEAGLNAVKTIVNRLMNLVEDGVENGDINTYRFLDSCRAVVGGEHLSNVQLGVMVVLALEIITGLGPVGSWEDGAIYMGDADSSAAPTTGRYAGMGG